MAVIQADGSHVFVALRWRQIVDDVAAGSAHPDAVGWIDMRVRLVWGYAGSSN